MNFATLFVRRPVTTTLIQLAIVIFGIMGYRTLPVSDLPTIDYPTIQVSASLPGANPETMAAAAALEAPPAPPVPAVSPVAGFPLGPAPAPPTAPANC